MIYYLASAIIGLVVGVSSVFAIPAENTHLQDMEKTTQSVLGLDTGAEREIFGFMPFWIQNATAPDYENYLTTLSYFGVGLNSDGSIQQFSAPGEAEPGLQLLENDSFRQKLKQAQENGVRLSLVAQLMDAKSIDALLTDPEGHAETFIEEVTPLMREHGFTDLNIDIEKPGFETEENRQRFTDFIRAVRSGVDRNELGTIGIDVIAKSLIEQQLTDVASLEPYVNYVVLMTYDFHYTGSYIAGPVAPINGAGIKRAYDVTTTIQEALKVLPPDKIIMGVPFYGYEWDTITDVPGGPTIRGTAKIRTHKQLMNILNECDDSCLTGTDEVYLQPYIIKPDNDGNGDYYRHIFYEDTNSLGRKLALVEEYNIRGIALWAIGYEDTDITDLLRSYKQSMEEE